MAKHWDIFCKVVDNYGDIGIAWRLARQLVAEHGLAVRVWVDDLQPFARLCPGTRADAAQQWHEGVDVRQWPADWVPVAPAPVVIEAFGCTLPALYIEALNAQTSPSLWLNLDYLSAEDWVEGCHGLPSLGGTGYRKFFFFPGFTERTGGLLREAGLLAARQGFEPGAFLASLGVEPKADALRVSLFAYENLSLGGWLQAMADGAQAVHLLVPEGRVQASVAAWLGQALTVGTPVARGALTLQALPFLAQGDYDRLLWACDFNAVRGEDSFVRAQWAGRPLLWHIYPQEEDAHRVKLEAFLARYLDGLPAAAHAALHALNLAWNFNGDMAGAWQQVLAQRPALAAHAEHWCAQRAAQPDLATALVQFHRNWL